MWSADRTPVPNIFFFQKKKLFRKKKCAGFLVSWDHTNDLTRFFSSTPHLWILLNCEPHLALFIGLASSFHMADHALIGSGRRYCGYWIFGISTTWTLDIWDFRYFFFKLCWWWTFLNLKKKKMIQEFSIKNLIFRSQLLAIWKFYGIFGFFLTWILDIWLLKYPCPGPTIAAWTLQKLHQFTVICGVGVLYFDFDENRKLGGGGGEGKRG